MNKKIILGLLVFVGVASAILVLVIAKPANHRTSDKNAGEVSQEKSIVKTELAADQAPQAFPANIPIEKGAKITQNFNATALDGRLQATRAFETALTLSQNFNLYRDFMNKNGWKIDTTVDLENYKIIAASKERAKLQVSIDKNQGSGVKTVSISYTESPANQ